MSDRNRKRLQNIAIICSVLATLLCLVLLVIVLRPKNGGGASGSKTSEKKKAGWSEDRRVAGLSFSRESGVYAEEFELTVLVQSKKTVKTVYYTLDGSNPTNSASREELTEGVPIVSRAEDPNVLAAVDPGLFDSAHVRMGSDRKSFVETLKAPGDEVVDKCTVVKAVVEYKDGSFSQVITGTYFIGTIEEHVAGVSESSKAQPLGKLAILSITMEYDDLFDAEKGIYVRGNLFEDSLKKHIASGQKIEPDTARRLLANYSARGREWERATHVDFFESDGTTTELILSQDCGIRIQGNYSRSDYQKSFRLYARSEYGDNNFRYPIFGEDCKDDKGETLDRFKTLILRNGGNCAFSMKYNTDYWSALIRDLDVSTQNSRPCVVYLNGEYWGLYVMQEDYSDDYFEDHYGVAKENVILYKGDAETYACGYKLDLGDLPEGETDVAYYYRDLWNFFNTHEDCVSEKDYEALCELVDPQSVLDYFAVQIWINNKWDWPGKNWSMWKTLTVDSSNPYGDGRFRFCCYDLEFGGISGSSEAKTNTIKEDNYKPHGMLDRDTNNPAVLCFVYLMSNRNFRDQYLEKLNTLSEEEFAYDSAYAKLLEFRDSYTPLYEQFFHRYNDLGSAEDCNEGYYSSVRCIGDYLKSRPKYIPKMVEWVRKFYGDL